MKKETNISELNDCQNYKCKNKTTNKVLCSECLKIFNYFYCKCCGNFCYSKRKIGLCDRCGYGSDEDEYHYAIYS